MNPTIRSTRRTGPLPGRAVTAVMAAAVGLVGLTGCGDSSEGPEAGAVSVSDLQGVEDQVADLEDRVGALEDGADLPTDTEGVDEGVDQDVDDTGAFFSDTASYLGQQVTVSAEVTELATTTEVGGAFWIAGEGSEPIAVVSASPPPALDINDVAAVSGTVMEIRSDTFEQDFGVAADALFDDPEAWFEEMEGQIAISSDRIEVLQEQSDE